MSRFEAAGKVAMCPDRSVMWHIFECDGGRLLVNPDAPMELSSMPLGLKVPRNARPPATASGSANTHATYIVDGVQTRRKIFKPIEAGLRDGGLDGLRANVGLAAGLDATEARLGDWALRGVSIYAAFMPEPRDYHTTPQWLMEAIPGRTLFRVAVRLAEVPGKPQRIEVYDEAIRSVGFASGDVDFDDHNHNLMTTNTEPALLHKIDVAALCNYADKHEI